MRIGYLIDEQEKIAMVYPKRIRPITLARFSQTRRASSLDIVPLRPRTTAQARVRAVRVLTLLTEPFLFFKYS